MKKISLDEKSDIFIARASLILSLRQNSIVCPDILKAFESVAHEKFVPFEYLEYAYKDKTLPLGFSQSMTSPIQLAKIFLVLEPKGAKKILEIGTGSGYSAAVLSRLAKRVFTLEINKSLAKTAQQNWIKAKISGTIGFIQNGKDGLNAQMPFDRILINGAIKEIPQNILDQLSDEGILVAPVGLPKERAIITKVERQREQFIYSEHGSIIISDMFNK